ncbi:MAG: TonB-dependent receptor [Gammaproteobacteria bacterium]
MLPVRPCASAFRALLLLLAGVITPVVGATGYAGQPVRAVLQELQSAGITLVYNDELVPAELRVLTEPVASAGIALVDEILAPHRLKTQSVGPGTWIIVRVAADAGAPGASQVSRRLAAPATALEEVIVTASQYNLARAAPEGRTFLTQDELRRLPKMADEPLRAVHRLPGAASNGLSGLAHIRGGEENETEIYLDGMPLLEPFHLRNFFSPVSVLDGEIVADLDVYAGGFPVDYGGRMSAVIDARSVDPAADGSYAVGLSLYHLNALAGSTFADGRGRWLASARRSNLSQVLNLAESDLGDPRYIDSFLKAEYDLDDRTTVAAHALYAEDQVNINNSGQTEFARTRDRNIYLWTTLEHAWSDDLRARALLAWTGVEKDRTGTVDDAGRISGAVSDQRDANSVLLRLEVEQGDDSLRWRAGLDAALLTADYVYASRLETTAGYPFPGSSAETLVRDAAVAPDGSQTGAFVAARWRISTALTGELGLRWDNQTYDRVGGGTQLSPRANLLYDLSPDTQVRASWGRFYQAQGINELQLEDGVGNFFQAQRADHFILSIEHNFAENLSARIEAYYKGYQELKPRYENLFDPLVLLPELRTDRVRVAPTDGLVRGVEFLLRNRSSDPWGWWLGYTWSRAEETIDRSDGPRSWDQRHTFNGGISWNRGPWDLALAGTWHTGWPTTAAALTTGPDPEVVVGARNAARFADFSSLDLRAGYTFDVGAGQVLAFFEVTNLLGLKNPCCAEYTVVDTGTGSPELRRSVDYWPRFVPNLGVLWKF